MRFLNIVLIAPFLLQSAVAEAVELTGVWEISSLGGDRRVEIWHDGEQLTAYRVLWPEFEGERYKLEHVFRGKITGTDLSGKLLVKEDGMPNFDDLRAFDGRVDDDSKITLDGMPLRRTDEKLSSEPPQLTPAKRRSLRGPKMGAAQPVRLFRPGVVINLRWEVA
ncbi:MAG: hypothetical protein A2289_15260 [Deltaproteobacteria bacterium RIFOXYA12_FULL_58_15]|nr:MAG: hypothetical protein A2289_15260 [Deltaproteobacteria bacterium RIFOXYA12_FULL_58_15]OGR10246.1 MAG: hypothetical protein A2341_22060 [Deltaproteobacteria bacterium RIFOXYB12_FULL_58_9]